MRHSHVPNRTTLAFAGALVFAIAAGGCSALLGLTDVPQSADASAAGGDASSTPPVDASGAMSDATVDAGPATDAAEPSDAGLDAPAPEASPCGDTVTSAHNCGRCGHDCLGGTCSMSACQPFPLVAADSGVSPFGLAQDDSFLYWTDDNNDNVERTDKTTGATLILDKGTTYFPRGIAVDDAGIFWGDATGVWSCPRAGCAAGPAFVANEMSVAVASVAIDAVNVYWTEGFGFVLAASRSGTNQSATSLWAADAAVDAGTNNVATDGQRVYFTATDGLLRGVSVDGSAPFAIGQANPGGSWGVAVDDASVYWSETDPADGSIDLASKASLAPVGIAAGQYYPGSIATDGTNAYWIATTEDAGAATVVGCTVASCVPALLGSGYTYAVAIVADKDAIYWTDNGSTSNNGSIWKLAK
ncbi:MAG: hypothetical protein ACLP1X_13210 [Polyangiaceae bacterium]